MKNTLATRMPIATRDIPSALGEFLFDLNIAFAVLPRTGQTSKNFNRGQYNTDKDMDLMLLL